MLELLFPTIPESITILGHYADGCRLGGDFSGVETSELSPVSLQVPLTAALSVSPG